MKVLVAVILVLGLSACAGGPGDGSGQVELEGRITAVMAGSGERSYVLDVAGEGLLPLDAGGERPPLNATGVIVEVPDGVELPDGAAGRFEALAEWTAETGESLTVIGYLTP